MMVAGILGLFAAISAPAMGQAVPRELPPGPLPELPSVSEYSLPPGDSQAPVANPAQGPTEENIPQPSALPSRNTTAPKAPNAPPIIRPVPNDRLPRTGNAQPNASEGRPAPKNNTPPNLSSNPAEEPSSGPAMTSSVSESPQTGDQSQPGFSSDLSNPSDASDTPLPNSIPEPMASSSMPETEQGQNIAIYVGAALAFLLLSGIGIYFWRRKSSLPSHKETELVEAEVALPIPAQKSRKPAPKIYSPPNPSEPAEPSTPRNPSPVSSDGFITSKTGILPQRPRTDMATPPVAPKRETVSMTSSAKHLQIEFIATGASSTLLNAVLNYTLKLSNISEQDLRNIRLSGTMTQADAESAKSGASELTGQLHGALQKVETLSAGEAVTLTGDIRVPLNSIRPIIFKSQALFIPLARFGVDYIDDTGSPHQHISSYIVGREYEPRRPKMAPFRLDQGPRNFARVGQRTLNNA